MSGYSTGLKFTVGIIVIIYMAAGILCLAQLHYQGGFQLLWVFLGGFWLFLGVRLWHMGHIARGITLLHLWLVVLSATLVVVLPQYVPYLPMGIVSPDVTEHPAVLIIAVVLAVIAIAVLARHKNRFR